MTVCRWKEQIGSYWNGKKGHLFIVEDASGWHSSVIWNFCNCIILVKVSFWSRHVQRSLLMRLASFLKMIYEYMEHCVNMRRYNAFVLDMHFIFLFIIHIDGVARCWRESLYPAICRICRNNTEQTVWVWPRHLCSKKNDSSPHQSWSSITISWIALS